MLSWRSRGGRGRDELWYLKGGVEHRFHSTSLQGLIKQLTSSPNASSSSSSSSSSISSGGLTTVTCASLTNMPCPCLHSKSLLNDTDPSFLPVLVGSSIPTHLPGANSVAPTNLTIPSGCLRCLGTDTTAPTAIDVLISDDGSL